MILTLATLATALPVWIGRYLPLLDYPNHLSNVFVWRHLSDPAYGFSRFYQLHLVPLPYWVQYGAVYLLAFPFGEETAQKLFLTLALLSLPLAVALYARRLGRDPRLCLFAFPLAWNYNVSLGFLNYAAGTSALFFALVLLDRYASRPHWLWGLLSSLAGASRYFFHILSWGAYLAVGGVTSVMAPRRLRLGSLLLAPLPLVPALAVGLWAYQASKTMNVPLSPFTGRGLAGLDMVHYEVAGVLHGLPDWLMNVHPGWFDEAAMAVLGFCWLMLLVTPAKASDKTHHTGNAPLRNWRLEAAALAATALLFLLPRTLHRPFYWYAINTRIAVLAALFFTLWVRGPITGVAGAAGVRRPIFWFAAVFAIGHGLVMARHVYRFNVRARGFDEVMAKVEPGIHGPRVLSIMENLGDPDINVNAFNQWGSYVQMRQGGFVPYGVDMGFPTRHISSVPAPPNDHPEAFNWALHGAHWDLFLVHGPSRVDPFGGAHNRVRSLAKSGDWELWTKEQQK